MEYATIIAVSWTIFIFMSGVAFDAWLTIKKYRKYEQASKDKQSRLENEIARLTVKRLALRKACQEARECPVIWPTGHTSCVSLCSPCSPSGGLFFQYQEAVESGDLTRAADIAREIVGLKWRGLE